MDEPIIQLNNVSVVFDLHKERVSGLKEYFIKRLKRELKSEKFYALNGIDLSLSKGDIFGILGNNGAGKSTLLKVIAGILAPTGGKIVTRGNIAPLIELGAGFDMELTARENIYLNGAILGYSRKFIDSKFEDIVNFAEIHEFLDVPLKNYSSGMVARIGFSIATITEPDILIVDEILSVGDYRFQKKCEERIKSMMSEDTTVILVSHQIDQIRNMCNKAVLLDKGKIIYSGTAEDVCDYYISLGQEVV
ncbi:MAG: teichoic acid ABC transporter ATP-binding protein [Thermobacillus sp.]|uniref:ABC transporter ATP-binding protein n=1 Tax=Thermobacillus sp. TaxID=2108467 RepID=UPI000E3A2933|nr:ABC transporter ATP-binding protein [Thermobacillus sp.]REK55520.1 MAG: teichoic acid ABC transporter ATP-binding protein [Thermobacillus sp.]